MSSQLRNSLLLSPAILGAAVGLMAPAKAAEIGSQPFQIQSPAVQIQPSNRGGLPHVAEKKSGLPTAMRVASVDLSDAQETAAVDALDQVTSVSQLTDVRPTDWAFQALQSLVERYGCIVGYPDKTYRGNRALSRYEFAAGVNACLDRINELLAAATADLVKKEDLAILQKLQEEFASELVTLRGRVDALEARTATLEKQQFSTTTKLNGEVVFALAGVATGDDAFGNRVSRNTVLGDRVRLNFDTSFTGEDLLRTRFQAGNLNIFSSITGTPEGDLRFNADSGNAVGIDALLYQFPLGERTTVTLEANAGATDDFIPTINPFLDGDGGSGALTHFGTRNPIYYLLGGSGIGISHAFSEQLELGLGYLADNGTGAANLPFNGNGLFNGPYGAIAQLTFKPFDSLTIGATYIHSYKTDFSTAGSTGSNRANFVTATGLPFSTNAFGLGASFTIAPQIVLNGSVGYTRARSIGSGFRGDADIWNWSVGLAFPDLLKKGSIAGIIVGMEPKVTEVDGNLSALLSEDPDTSLHIEGFYQFQLSDNIAITPGLIYLTAPDHNDANDGILIGVIRTTFTF
ncbi:iron uptake porin [Kovacikia minuta CCNUW1]|uniref:iron uptake porin n=1 Tax=Kovacikia minuta TaxID=2931930 RepID=UPI001CCE41D4|nr:iron uptake porin [Kovacikia minuta]UBF26773.1 iron uptake porin [Kovacikia minuta CCNUW1]